MLRSDAAAALVAAAAIFGGCAVFAVKAVALLHPMSAAVSRTHTVEIRGFEFVPARLDVSPGDTIRWLNRDPVPHTATARDSTWDSGRIPAGGEWRLVVARDITAGYLCVYHPTMTATLTVSDPDR